MKTGAWRTIKPILLIAVLLVVPCHGFAAVQWTSVAVISPTATFSSSYLCYTDGKGIACNNNAPSINDEVKSLPSGAVVSFDSNYSCPVGWSEYIAARGRFIRGIDAAGTTDPSGTRAYGNLQGGSMASHAHTFDPVNTALSTDPDHSHTVDPASVTTGAGGSHNHTNTALTGTSLATNNHSHTMGGGYQTNTTATGAQGRIIGFGQADVTGPTSSAGAHTHSTTTDGGYTTGAESSHAHTIDIASTGSSGYSDHTHTVDIAATASTASGNAAEVRPANVALYYCIKD